MKHVEGTGKPKNILSEHDVIYYKKLLNKILEHALKKGECSTSSFEYLDRREYCIVGKSNRPFLRKCLRTLEYFGLIENINLGFNIHHWKITELGKNRLEVTTEREN